MPELNININTEASQEDLANLDERLDRTEKKINDTMNKLERMGNAFNDAVEKMNKTVNIEVKFNEASMLAQFNKLQAYADAHPINIKTNIKTTQQDIKSDILSIKKIIKKEKITIPIKIKVKEITQKEASNIATNIQEKVNKKQIFISPKFHIPLSHFQSQIIKMEKMMTDMVKRIQAQLDNLKVKVDVGGGKVGGYGGSTGGGETNKKGAVYKQGSQQYDQHIQLYNKTQKIIQEAQKHNKQLVKHHTKSLHAQLIKIFKEYGFDESPTSKATKKLNLNNFITDLNNNLNDHLKKGSNIKSVVDTFDNAIGQATSRYIKSFSRSIYDNLDTNLKADIAKKFKSAKIADAIPLNQMKKSAKEFFSEYLTLHLTGMMAQTKIPGARFSINQDKMKKNQAFSEDFFTQILGDNQLKLLKRNDNTIIRLNIADQLNKLLNTIEKNLNDSIKLPTVSENKELEKTLSKTYDNVNNKVIEKVSKDAEKNINKSFEDARESGAISNTKISNDINKTASNNMTTYMQGLSKEVQLFLEKNQSILQKHHSSLKNKFPTLTKNLEWNTDLDIQGVLGQYINDTISLNVKELENLFKQEKKTGLKESVAHFFEKDDSKFKLLATYYNKAAHKIFEGLDEEAKNKIKKEFDISKEVSFAAPSTKLMGQDLENFFAENFSIYMLSKFKEAKAHLKGTFALGSEKDFEKLLISTVNETEVKEDIIKELKDKYYKITFALEKLHSKIIDKYPKAFLKGLELDPIGMNLEKNNMRSSLSSKRLTLYPNQIVENFKKEPVEKDINESTAELFQKGNEYEKVLADYYFQIGHHLLKNLDEETKLQLKENFNKFKDKSITKKMGSGYKNFFAESFALHQLSSIEGLEIFKSLIPFDIEAILDQLKSIKSFRATSSSLVKKYHEDLLKELPDITKNLDYDFNLYEENKLAKYHANKISFNTEEMNKLFETEIDKNLKKPTVAHAFPKGFGKEKSLAVYYHEAAHKIFPQLSDDAKEIIEKSFKFSKRDRNRTVLMDQDMEEFFAENFSIYMTSKYKEAKKYLKESFLMGDKDTFELFNKSSFKDLLNPNYKFKTAKDFLQGTGTLWGDLSYLYDDYYEEGLKIFKDTNKDIKLGIIEKYESDKKLNKFTSKKMGQSPITYFAENYAMYKVSENLHGETYDNFVKKMTMGGINEIKGISDVVLNEKKEKNEQIKIQKGIENKIGNFKEVYGMFLKNSHKNMSNMFSDIINNLELNIKYFDDEVFSKLSEDSIDFNVKSISNYIDTVKKDTKKIKDNSIVFFKKDDTIKKIKMIYYREIAKKIFGNLKNEAKITLKKDFESRPLKSFSTKLMATNLEEFFAENFALYMFDKFDSATKEIKDAFVLGKKENFENFLTENVTKDLKIAGTNRVKKSSEEYYNQNESNKDKNFSDSENKLNRATGEGYVGSDYDTEITSNTRQDLYDNILLKTEDLIETHSRLKKILDEFQVDSMENLKKKLDSTEDQETKAKRILRDLLFAVKRSDKKDKNVTYEGLRNEDIDLEKEIKRFQKPIFTEKQINLDPDSNKKRLSAQKKVSDLIQYSMFYIKELNKIRTKYVEMKIWDEDTSELEKEFKDLNKDAYYFFDDFKKNTLFKNELKIGQEEIKQAFNQLTKSGKSILPKTDTKEFKTLQQTVEGFINNVIGITGEKHEGKHPFIDLKETKDGILLKLRDFETTVRNGVVGGSGVGKNIQEIKDLDALLNAKDFPTTDKFFKEMNQYGVLFQEDFKGLKYYVASTAENLSILQNKLNQATSNIRFDKNREAIIKEARSYSNQLNKNEKDYIEIFTTLKNNTDDIYQLYFDTISKAKTTDFEELTKYILKEKLHLPQPKYMSANFNKQFKNMKTQKSPEISGDEIWGSTTSNVVAQMGGIADNSLDDVNAQELSSTESGLNDATKIIQNYNKAKEKIAENQKDIKEKIIQDTKQLEKVEKSLETPEQKIDTAKISKASTKKRISGKELWEKFSQEWDFVRKIEELDEKQQKAIYRYLLQYQRYSDESLKKVFSSFGNFKYKKPSMVKITEMGSNWDLYKDAEKELNELKERLYNQVFKKIADEDYIKLWEKDLTNKMDKGLYEKRDSSEGYEKFWESSLQEQEKTMQEQRESIANSLRLRERLWRSSLQEQERIDQDQKQYQEKEKKIRENSLKEQAAIKKQIAQRKIDNEKRKYKEDKNYIEKVLKQQKQWEEEEKKLSQAREKLFNDRKEFPIIQIQNQLKQGMSTERRKYLSKNYVNELNEFSEILYPDIDIKNLTDDQINTIYKEIDRFAKNKKDFLHTNKTFFQDLNKKLNKEIDKKSSLIFTQEWFREREQAKQWKKQDKKAWEGISGGPPRTPTDKGAFFRDFMGYNRGAYGIKRDDNGFMKYSLLGKFAQFGMVMSGIAATVFVIQQAIQILSQIIALTVELENELNKVAFAAQLGSKEYEQMKLHAIELSKQTGFTNKEVITAQSAMIDRGIALTDKNEQSIFNIMENPEVDAGQAAKIIQLGTTFGMTDLQDRYEGYADYTAKTIGDEAEKTKEILKSILTTFFFEYEDYIKNAIKSIGQFFNENSDAIKTFAKAMLDAIPVITKFILVLGGFYTLYNIIGMFATAGKALAGLALGQQFFVIAAGITAVYAAFQDFNNLEIKFSPNTKAFLKELDDIWSGLKFVTKYIGSGVLQSAEQLITMGSEGYTHQQQLAIANRYSQYRGTAVDDYIEDIGIRKKQETIENEKELARRKALGSKAFDPKTKKYLISFEEELDAHKTFYDKLRVMTDLHYNNEVADNLNQHKKMLKTMKKELAERLNAEKNYLTERKKLIADASNLSEEGLKVHKRLKSDFGIVTPELMKEREAERTAKFKDVAFFTKNDKNTQIYKNIQDLKNQIDMANDKFNNAHQYIQEYVEVIGKMPFELFEKNLVIIEKERMSALETDKLSGSKNTERINQLFDKKVDDEMKKFNKFVFDSMSKYLSEFGITDKLYFNIKRTEAIKEINRLELPQQQKDQLIEQTKFNIKQEELGSDILSGLELTKPQVQYQEQILSQYQVFSDKLYLYKKDNLSKIFEADLNYFNNYELALALFHTRVADLDKKYMEAKFKIQKDYHNKFGIMSDDYYQAQLDSINDREQSAIELDLANPSSRGRGTSQIREMFTEERLQLTYGKSIGDVLKGEDITALDFKFLDELSSKYQISLDKVVNIKEKNSEALMKIDRDRLSSILEGQELEAAVAALHNQRLFKIEKEHLESLMQYQIKYYEMFGKMSDTAYVLKGYLSNQERENALTDDMLYRGGANQDAINKYYDEKDYQLDKDKAISNATDLTKQEIKALEDFGKNHKIITEDYISYKKELMEIDKEESIKRLGDIYKAELEHAKKSMDLQKEIAESKFATDYFLQQKTGIMTPELKQEKQLQLKDQKELLEDQEIQRQRENILETNPEAWLLSEQAVTELATEAAQENLDKIRKAFDELSRDLNVESKKVITDFEEKISQSFGFTTTYLYENKIERIEALISKYKDAITTFYKDDTTKLENALKALESLKIQLLEKTKITSADEILRQEGFGIEYTGAISKSFTMGQAIKRDAKNKQIDSQIKNYAEKRRDFFLDAIKTVDDQVLIDFDIRGKFGLDENATKEDLKNAIWKQFDGAMNYIKDKIKNKKDISFYKDMIGGFDVQQSIEGVEQAEGALQKLYKHYHRTGIITDDMKLAVEKAIEAQIKLLLVTKQFPTEEEKAKAAFMVRYKHQAELMKNQIPLYERIRKELGLYNKELQDFDKKTIQANYYSNLKTLGPDKKYIVDLIQELEKLEQAKKEVFAKQGSWELGFEAMGKGTSIALKELERDFIHFGEFGYKIMKDFASKSESTISDVLFDGMKGNLKSFSDYWEAILDSMRRNFANFVAQIAQQKIIMPIVQSVGGSVLGSVLGGVGGAGAGNPLAMLTGGGGEGFGLSSLGAIGEGFSNFGSAIYNQMPTFMQGWTDSAGSYFGGLMPSMPQGGFITGASNWLSSSFEGFGAANAATDTAGWIGSPEQLINGTAISTEAGTILTNMQALGAGIGGLTSAIKAVDLFGDENWGQGGYAAVQSGLYAASLAAPNPFTLGAAALMSLGDMLGLSDALATNKRRYIGGQYQIGTSGMPVEGGMFTSEMTGESTRRLGEKVAANTRKAMSDAIQNAFTQFEEVILRLTSEQQEAIFQQLESESFEIDISTSAKHGDWEENLKKRFQGELDQIPEEIWDGIKESLVPSFNEFAGQTSNLFNEDNFIDVFGVEFKDSWDILKYDQQKKIQELFANLGTIDEDMTWEEAQEVIKPFFAGVDSVQKYLEAIQKLTDAFKEATQTAYMTSFSKSLYQLRKGLEENINALNALHIKQGTPEDINGDETRIDETGGTGLKPGENKQSIGNIIKSAWSQHFEKYAVENPDWDGVISEDFISTHVKPTIEAIAQMYDPLSMANELSAAFLASLTRGVGWSDVYMDMGDFLTKYPEALGKGEGSLGKGIANLDKLIKAWSSKEGIGAQISGREELLDIIKEMGYAGEDAWEKFVTDVIDPATNVIASTKLKELMERLNTQIFTGENMSQEAKTVWDSIFRNMVYGTTVGSTPGEAMYATTVTGEELTQEGYNILQFWEALEEAFGTDVIPSMEEFLRQLGATADAADDAGAAVGAYNAQLMSLVFSGMSPDSILSFFRGGNRDDFGSQILAGMFAEGSGADFALMFATWLKEGLKESLETTVLSQMISSWYASTLGPIFNEVVKDFDDLTKAEDVTAEDYIAYLKDEDGTIANSMKQAFDEAKVFADIAQTLFSIDGGISDLVRLQPSFSKIVALPSGMPPGKLEMGGHPYLYIPESTVYNANYGAWGPNSSFGQVAIQPDFFGELEGETPILPFAQNKQLSPYYVNQGELANAIYNSLDKDKIDDPIKALATSMQGTYGEIAMRLFDPNKIEEWAKLLQKGGLSPKEVEQYIAPWVEAILRQREADRLAAAGEMSEIAISQMSDQALLESAFAHLDELGDIDTSQIISDILSFNDLLKEFEEAIKSMIWQLRALTDSFTDIKQALEDLNGSTLPYTKDDVSLLNMPVSGNGGIKWWYDWYTSGDNDKQIQAMQKDGEKFGALILAVVQHIITLEESLFSLSNTLEETAQSASEWLYDNTLEEDQKSWADKGNLAYKNLLNYRQSLGIQPSINVFDSSMIVDLNDLEKNNQLILDAYNAYITGAQNEYSLWKELKETKKELIENLQETVDNIISPDFDINNYPEIPDNTNIKNMKEYLEDAQKWFDGLVNVFQEYWNFSEQLTDDIKDVQIKGEKEKFLLQGGTEQEWMDKRLVDVYLEATTEGLSWEEQLKKQQELEQIIMDRYDAEMEKVNDVKEAIESIDDKIQEVKYSQYNLKLVGERQKEAEKDYNELLAAAQSGDADADAINEYLGFVNTYLEESINTYKSSKAYHDIFDSVMADLENLGYDLGDTDKTAEEKRIEAINKNTKETAFLLDYLKNNMTATKIAEIANPFIEKYNEITGISILDDTLNSLSEVLISLTASLSELSDFYENQLVFINQPNPLKDNTTPTNTQSANIPQDIFSMITSGEFGQEVGNAISEPVTEGISNSIAENIQNLTITSPVTMTLEGNVEIITTDPTITTPIIDETPTPTPTEPQMPNTPEESETTTNPITENTTDFWHTKTGKVRYLHDGTKYNLDILDEFIPFYVLAADKTSTIKEAIASTNATLNEANQIKFEDLSSFPEGLLNDTDFNFSPENISKYLELTWDENMLNLVANETDYNPFDLLTHASSETIQQAFEILMQQARKTPEELLEFINTELFNITDDNLKITMQQIQDWGYFSKDWISDQLINAEPPEVTPMNEGQISSFIKTMDPILMDAFRNSEAFAGPLHTEFINFKDTWIQQQKDAETSPFLIGAFMDGGGPLVEEFKSAWEMQRPHAELAVIEQLLEASPWARNIQELIRHTISSNELEKAWFEYVKSTGEPLTYEQLKEAGFANENRPIQYMWEITPENREMFETMLNTGDWTPYGSKEFQLGMTQMAHSKATHLLLKEGYDEQDRLNPEYIKKYNKYFKESLGSFKDSFVETYMMDEINRIAEISTKKDLKSLAEAVAISNKEDADDSNEEDAGEIYKTFMTNGSYEYMLESTKKIVMQNMKDNLSIQSLIDSGIFPEFNWYEQLETTQDPKKLNQLYSSLWIPENLKPEFSQEPIEQQSTGFESLGGTKYGLEWLNLLYPSLIEKGDEKYNILTMLDMFTTKAIGDINDFINILPEEQAQEATDIVGEVASGKKQASSAIDIFKEFIKSLKPEVVEKNQDTINAIENLEDNSQLLNMDFLLKLDTILKAVGIRDGEIIQPDNPSQQVYTYDDVYNLITSEISPYNTPLSPMIYDLSNIVKDFYEKYTGVDDVLDYLTQEKYEEILQALRGTTPTGTEEPTTEDPTTEDPVDQGQNYIELLKQIRQTDISNALAEINPNLNMFELAVQANNISKYIDNIIAGTPQTENALYEKVIKKILESFDGTTINPGDTTGDTTTTAAIDGYVNQLTITQAVIGSAIISQGITSQGIISEAIFNNVSDTGTINLPEGYTSINDYISSVISGIIENDIVTNPGYTQSQLQGITLDQIKPYTTPVEKPLPLPIPNPPTIQTWPDAKTLYDLLQTGTTWEELSAEQKKIIQAILGASETNTSPTEGVFENVTIENAIINNAIINGNYSTEPVGQSNYTQAELLSVTLEQIKPYTTPVETTTINPFTQQEMTITSWPDAQDLYDLLQAGTPFKDLTSGQQNIITQILGNSSSATQDAIFENVIITNATFTTGTFDAVTITSLPTLTVDTINVTTLNGGGTTPSTFTETDITLAMFEKYFTNNPTAGLPILTPQQNANNAYSQAQDTLNPNSPFVQDAIDAIIAMPASDRSRRDFSKEFSAIPKRDFDDIELMPANEEIRRDKVEQDERLIEEQKKTNQLLEELRDKQNYIEINTNDFSEEEIKQITDNVIVRRNKRNVNKDKQIYK